MPDDALSTIENTIRGLIRAELGDAELGLASDIRFEELGLSSIKLLRMIAKLEKTYDVELDDDAIAHAETLGELAALIARQRT